MKLLVVLCLVAVVVAAPPPNYRSSNADTQLTNFYYDLLGYGSYKFGYSQTDGQQAEQTGQLKNEGREDEAQSVSGSYSWVGPDGVTYSVTYTADEEGYKPEIEQGPGGGVPPAVVASLLGYFSQSDGTNAEQVGTIKNEGRDEESLAVTGSFEWVAPDGVLYRVTYTADKDGYKPEITQGVLAEPEYGAPPAVVATLLGG